MRDIVRLQERSSQPPTRSKFIFDPSDPTLVVAIMKHCRGRVLFTGHIFHSVLRREVVCQDCVDYQIGKEYVVWHHRWRPVDVGAASIDGNIAVEILSGTRPEFPADLF